MKKNTMATAIVAGLAGVAGIANISTAVNLNPDGVGQVLLYPYYTVNGNNTTAISVVNTTGAAKAVKVRFLDARNSREVLDFNLYLSAYDVWTAGIFSLAATGPASIVTDDTSCTVPGIESSIWTLPTLPDGRNFIDFRSTLFSDLNGNPALAGPARTREGYVEMIELATIPNDDFFGVAATHSNGRPISCETLERAWLTGGTFQNGGGVAGWEAPSGGLFGGAAIINVGDGTYINYNAEAIDGFRTTIAHSEPSNILPNLASTSNSGNPIVSYVFDRGRLITSQWTPGTIGPVSAVLTKQAIFNEYVVDPDLAASSEWIVTFPTRKNHTTGAVTAPFTVAPTANLSGVGERVSVRIYDREEDTFRVFNFSPFPGTTQILWEAAPLWFQRAPGVASGTASPIMGASGSVPGTTAYGAAPPLWTPVPTYLQYLGIVQKTFTSGWLWLGFYDEQAVNAAGTPEPLVRPPLVENLAGLPDAQRDRYYGLPAIGFWALRVENANARPGVQGFYGGAYPHRAARACFKGDFGTTPCD